MWDLGNVTDPVNIVPVVLLLACFIWSGLPRGQEKFSAWWALLNGCLLHCWIDGIIAAFGRGPRWMVDTYALLDDRFSQAVKDPTVMVICYTELVLVGPLCLIWYNSIVKELWYRHFLAIVISTIHIYGTDIYAGTEILSGLSHLPPGVLPLNLGSREEFIYFWLIFVIGSLTWIVIPLWLIVKSSLAFRPKHDSLKEK